MICRVGIWFESVNIPRLSNVSVLMNERHSHRSIPIDWFFVPMIVDTKRKQIRIIHSLFSCYIIASLIDCKIVCIYSWPRIYFIEHEIIGPKNLFNKCRIVLPFNLIWISAVPKKRLRRIIIHVNSQLKLRNIVRKTKMFSAKWIKLIVKRNKENNNLV